MQPDIMQAHLVKFANNKISRYTNCLKLLHTPDLIDTLVFYLPQLPEVAEKEAAAEDGPSALELTKSTLSLDDWIDEAEGGATKSPAKKKKKNKKKGK